MCPNNKANILVVVDEPDIQHLVSLMLEEPDYKILSIVEKT
tara:strand:+ start:447 stop:569 length:123 start_codon:yes stop_codon:yes gene_type:complete